MKVCIRPAGAPKAAVSRRPNSGTCAITDSSTEVARTSRSLSLLRFEAGNSRATRQESFSASDFAATAGRVTFFFAVRARAGLGAGAAATGAAAMVSPDCWPGTAAGAGRGATSGAEPAARSA